MGCFFSVLLLTVGVWVRTRGVKSVSRVGCKLISTDEPSTVYPSHAVVWVLIIPTVTPAATHCNSYFTTYFNTYCDTYCDTSCTTYCTAYWNTYCNASCKTSCNTYLGIGFGLGMSKWSCPLRRRLPTNWWLSRRDVTTATGASVTRTAAEVPRAPSTCPPMSGHSSRYTSRLYELYVKCAGQAQIHPRDYRRGFDDKVLQ